MSVSTSISFNMTARAVVEKAMRLINVLGANENVNASDGEDARISLNMMIKTWEADGCNLWREQPSTVTFPANTATMTLDPRVVDVIEARRVYVDTPDSELPLGRWERGQYISIPNKNNTGIPVAFYPQRNRDSFTMTLWPVPYVETVINFTAARVTRDVSELADNIDVPQEWLECVVYNLADRLATEWGSLIVEAAVAKKVERRAAELYSLMRDFDRPGYVTMGH